MIAKNKQPQMTAIPGMTYDWSQVVTRDGKQLQTVGTHWPASAPLPQDMRIRMERTGVCRGCHEHMSDKDLWRKLNTNPGILNNKDHINKIGSIFIDASKGC